MSIGILRDDSRGLDISGARSASGARFLAACLLGILIAVPMAIRAATEPSPPGSFSFDFTDLYWNPKEAGWGLQLVQSNNLVFATLYVYDQEGKPTWATAEMTWNGDDTMFTERAYVVQGPLYVTTGPWFATKMITPPEIGFFDPTRVTWRLAGSMRVDYMVGSWFAVTYSIDGVTVTKMMDRQTLHQTSYAPAYVAVRHLSGRVNGVPTTTTDTINVAISMGTGTMSMQWSNAATSCSSSGNYRQWGRMGFVEGTYTCSDGDSGNLWIQDMSVGIGTISGSWSQWNPNSATGSVGTFAGVALQ